VLAAARVRNRFRLALGAVRAKSASVVPRVIASISPRTFSTDREAGRDPYRRIATARGRNCWLGHCQA